MPEQWSNFFVMVGSGAAALAGLIFVAMSINPERIIRNTTHKNRAINMLTGFTAVFMACSFALIGNQYLGALGFEWLVLWLIARQYRSRGRKKKAWAIPTPPSDKRWMFVRTFNNGVLGKYSGTVAPQVLRTKPRHHFELNKLRKCSNHNRFHFY